MTRTYTPEAIKRLVAAAGRVAALNERAGEIGAGMLATIVTETREALRPFTTEPSSWAAYLREQWGDHWGVDGHEPTSAEWDQARAAYRARYGVEP